MHRSTILVAAILGILLAMQGAFAASSIVITFKDGTKVSADLPQDIAQISSVSFESGAGPATSATVPGVNLKDVVLSDAMENGLGTTWDALQCVGGNFASFAKFQDGKLMVNVPAGNHWGKTGLMSKKPLFTVDNTMDANPMKIVFDFDADNTTGYVIALASAENNDVWLSQNYWLHRGISSETKKGFTYFVNTQNGNDKATPSEFNGLPVEAPKRIVLSVSHGFVKAELPDGKVSTCSLGWLKSGTPVYVHIFSHPENDNGPASFSLDAITVGR